MTDNHFTFCPKCGERTIDSTNGRRWTCGSCGFDLYSNVAAAVGIIISDRSDTILFEIRAKNPRKGFLALPGGFCDADETAESAAIRECEEETGLKPQAVSYLCSFPNSYEYKNIAYKTCDLFFTAELPENAGTIEELIKKLHGQKTEVTGFKAYKITCTKDIENIPLAFDSAKKALTAWLSCHKIEQRAEHL